MLRNRGKKKKSLLGDREIEIFYFDGLDPLFKKFAKNQTSSLHSLSHIVNESLLGLIQKAKEPCFLLPAVLEYVKRVEEEGILHHYNFNSFEIWLNQFSGLSFEENFHIRSKIAGKWLERGDYQNLFPIGMGKMYSGTHFVTAHKSPDLDTTIASFWGWLDAFAARVSEGIHVWNLPDGPPSSQIEIDWIFINLFGTGVFTHLPKTRTILNLTGSDLMTQKGIRTKKVHDSIASIDHDRDQNAVLVVDEQGFFLGDWRAFDAEGVRQVIVLVSSCLRWFENTLHLDLISFFSKETLTLGAITPILNRLMKVKLCDSEPALEFTVRQKKNVDDFLKSVLGMKRGIEATIEDLSAVLCDLADVPFGGVDGLINKMKKAKLFNAKGELIDERPRIFSFLESAIQSLHSGIMKIRARMEKLDIALKTKTEVFGHLPTSVDIRSDVEEIRNKMTDYSYLTVAYLDQGQLYPAGVIQAADLRKKTLGTVSLRDFSNREEMGIPSYLEVISIIDHHKTALSTFTPPMAIVSDAQSSNTIVAQKAFEINDLIDRFKGHKAHKNSPYFLHPERAFIEYLHFIYGIIDDTDLLSKVSTIDVECVASLLNRMKSIASGKREEVVSLDDIPRDMNFAKKSAQRILQNEEMYSLYRKVYEHREKEVEKNISLCSKDEPSNFFADTKEQNGCSRIGQTKMFAVNISHFHKSRNEICSVWLKRAMKVYHEKPEIDLHIHMISTIVSAEEVYLGKVGKYEHQDELWIWISEKEESIEHLKRFLSNFQLSPGIQNNPLEVEFWGNNGDELSLIFKESFLDIPHKKLKKELPVAVLKYKAGSLNSRKAMVSPFLPTLSS